MSPKQFAINIAQKAGKIIRDNFTLGMKKEWKADETPITATDQKINNLVVEAVKQNFPDYGILAEEGGNYHEKADKLWVCDPLDGTVPFSHGIPTSVFTLALVQEGSPILGVIFDPFQNRLLFAEKGKGAFLNDKPIEVTDLKDLKKSVIGITIWRTAPYDLIKFTGLLVKKGAILVGPGSTAYSGMLVASGEITGNVWPGKTPWDVAAQKIIVEEAGGKVTDFFGQDQRYDRNLRGAVVTNGQIHDQIIEMIKESGVKP